MPSALPSSLMRLTRWPAVGELMSTTTTSRSRSDDTYASLLPFTTTANGNVPPTPPVTPSLPREERAQVVLVADGAVGGVDDADRVVVVVGDDQRLAVGARCPGPPALGLTPMPTPLLVLAWPEAQDRRRASRCRRSCCRRRRRRPGRRRRRACCRRARRPGPRGRWSAGSPA